MSSVVGERRPSLGGGHEGVHQGGASVPATIPRLRRPLGFHILPSRCWQRNGTMWKPEGPPKTGNFEQQVAGSRCSR